MSRSPRSGWAVSGETSTSVLTTHRPCGIPKPAYGQGFCRPPRFGCGQLFRRGTPPATECAAATVTNRKGNLTSIRRSAPRGAVIAVATAALAVRADVNMTQPASPATVSMLARTGFNIVPSRKVPAMALSRSVSRACRTTPTTSRSPDWHLRRRRACEVPVKAAGGRDLHHHRYGRTGREHAKCRRDTCLGSLLFWGVSDSCTTRSCAASSCGCGRRPATHRSGRPATASGVGAIPRYWVCARQYLLGTAVAEHRLGVPVTRTCASASTVPRAAIETGKVEPPPMIWLAGLKHATATLADGTT